MLTLRTLSAAAPLAALLLAGCGEPETIVAGPQDDMANQAAAAPPVSLPPAIKASKTYRCADNSLVYVTFLSDDMTAMVREKADAPPIATLKAPAAGEPYVFEGYSLSGQGDEVTYKAGGKSQSCHT